MARIVVVALSLLLTVSAQARSGDQAEAWLQQGWDVLGKQGLDAAVETWQEAIDVMPPGRLLLNTVGIFRDQSNALHAVKRLGSDLRGVAVKGMYRGSEAYFVLAAPGAKEFLQVRTHLEQLISGGKKRLYSWAAGRFQVGGRFALPGARDSSLMASSHSPAVKQSVVKASKRKKPSRHHVAAKRHSAPVAHAVVHAKKRPPQPTPEESAQILFDMAKRAQAEGDHKRAIALLARLLKRTPDHAMARQLSGQLMIDDGQYDAAWQVMQPLLRPQSLDWRPWFWSGTAELMSGRLGRAGDHLDEALARDGRVAAVWVQRALVAQQRGRYVAAWQLLRIAESLAPNSSVVLLNIGYTLEVLGQSKSASDYYNRYLVTTAGRAKNWKTRKAVLLRLEAMNQ
ncbi:MAG: tetratricopeptide repeat protein [Mariprofundales bacterium]